MVIGVIVDLKISSVDQVWDYLVDKKDISKIKIGRRVKVYFNHQLIIGFIVQINKSKPDLELNNVIEFLDNESYVNQRAINLSSILSWKYFDRKIDYLNLFVPSYMVIKPKTVYLPIDINSLNEDDLILFNKKGYFEKNFEHLNLRKDFVIENKNRKVKKIIRLNWDSDYKEFFIKNSRSKQLTNLYDILVNGSELEVNFKVLNKKNYEKLLINKIILVREVAIFRDISLNLNNKDNLLKNTLTTKQQEICNQINLTKYEETLIQGLTGSGKTHIFIELIKRVNQAGKVAFLLIPEVSLSYKIFEKIQNYIDNAYLLHYKVPDSYKRHVYSNIQKNKVNVIVGTRSSLFLNMKNIGLIIFDEEHDDDYYQSNTPIYDSKFLANIIAKNDNFPIVYSSATPSLDLIYRINRLEVKHLILDEKFSNFNNTFKICLKEPSRFISDVLKKEIQKRLDIDEQVILLFNKKAYAQFLKCSKCDYYDCCPNCNLARKVYVSKNIVKCLHCLTQKRIYSKCPKCNSMLNYSGNGIEKVHQELEQLFDVKINVLDGDILRNEKQRASIMKSIENNDTKIILGTQIISKGFDFKNITLGGIIDADNSLYLPTYKSSEETFQLLNQFIGRVGRHSQGHIILQTSQPENRIWELILNSNYDVFCKTELNIRNKYHMPPYVNVCFIQISDTNIDRAFNNLNKIKNELIKYQLNFSNIYQPFISKKGINYIFEIKYIYNKNTKIYKELHLIKSKFKSLKLKIAINPCKWM